MRTNTFQKLVSLFFLIAASACSQTQFSPASTATNTPQGSTSVPECGTNQISVNRPAKVLFVVDQSGSNQFGPDETASSGTDPYKTFRTGVLQKFYSENLSKSNISWGLTVFNDGSATNLMTNGSGSSVPFSSKASDFKKAMDKFSAREDIGGTPYKSALNLVRSMIATDRLTAPEHVIYLVVFLTDGYPTDYCAADPASSNCTGPVQNSVIFKDIQGITALVPNSVQFSTAYYGLPDSSAASRLEQMAKVGAGQFVDTNKSSGVKLDDLIKIDQPICVNK